jgi:hypothetical protein
MLRTMNETLHRIESLDVTLYSHVGSQSTLRDRRSLLALQEATARSDDKFSYLEIGSYRGGSLQPYVVDPRCTAIISIDLRPPSLPDARGTDLSYRHNSTEAMVELLSAIPDANLAKLHTIEGSTDRLHPSSLPVVPSLCLVDGEHTDEAALRDGMFCAEATGFDGCVVFHDTNVVFNGVQAFVDTLDDRGVAYEAYNLPDSLFVVELGASRLMDREPVRSLLRESFRGYLWSLAANEPFRAFYNRRPFQLARRAKARARNVLRRR